MAECLMVNREMNNLENKSALTVLKTRKSLIKSSDKIKPILICNIPIRYNENELCSKVSDINRKILTVVKCNTHFVVIYICDLSIDCQITYGLHLNEWSKRAISRIARDYVKTKKCQSSQLSGAVVLPRLSLAFDTGLPTPSPAAEVTYLRPTLASDDPSPEPEPEPDPTPEKEERGISLLSITQLIESSSELPVAMRNSLFLFNPTDIEEEEYNPFENRCVSHPTTDLETLIHLMKGSLGTGILAMPGAFKSAGLLFGLLATFIVGAICAYSIHILVKCAHKLCWRVKVPCLGFDDIAEVAFFAGPTRTKKFAKSARFIVNFFLVLDLLGCCCVYIVFVARNAKQVLDIILGREIDLRLYMVALLPFLIIMNLIPHLKYLAPFSMVANVLMATGVGITFYYVFQDLPSVMSRPKFSTVEQLPIFFGTAIFSLEGIGVVMPLENNMKTPTHFVGCPGVLNIGMTFVVLLYSSVGFFGYLKYGEDTEASITLNLPNNILAQAVKVMIAVAIFLTYSLQFHVPLGIILKGIRHKFTKHLVLGECILRITLVTMTVAIAVMVPFLGPFISLVGAVCLSFLGLMFPAIVEIVVCWGWDGLGPANWILWKNLGIILFGIIGFFTGSYTSILAIISNSKQKTFLDL